MKLSQIINSHEGLNALSKLSLPVKIAYKVSKLISKLQPDLKAFDEARNKLIQELGATDENGTTSVTKENIPKYIEEIQKLSDIDVEIEFSPGTPIEKIKLSDLGDIKIEPKDLLSLDWLIEE